MKGKKLSLVTRLSILQQGEYEWNHYQDWINSHPTWVEEITPKKWTVKLQLLSFFATVFSPLIGVDHSLQLGLVVLSLPQVLITSVTLFAAIVKLRIFQARGLQVIAIAGSYGKTSTKEILQHVVSAQYKSHKTPGNINRSLGIAREILQKLQGDHQYFFVELGEYNRGEIRQMVKMLRPCTVVITPITIAHLERFESLDEITEELFDAVRFSHAHAIIAKENEKNLPADLQTKKDISWYGEDDISQVEISRAGTEYVYSKKEQEISCFIPLYGKHNAVNTLPALIFGESIGISDDKLKQALSTLPFVPHRLEPTLLEQQILLLDNGYNSNPQSAVQALSVLRSLEGSQKIVTTPGFVELGAVQEKENTLLGERIAKVADMAVVIESVNHDALIRGLQKGGMKQSNIISAATEEDGMNKLQGKLKPSAIILFENSIPQLYRK